MRTRPVLSVACLATILSVVVVPPAGGAPPVSDPDAARGLDNLDWNPPLDVVRTASSSVVEDFPLTPPVAAQADDGEQATGSAEPTESYCAREPGEASSRLFGRGCWKVFRLGGNGDPANDYYFQKFHVAGIARKGTELHRVKGRNWADNGQNVEWDPTSDANYGDPETITASVSFGDGTATASVSHTFTLYPGRLHPFPGRQVFHSSWVAKDRTAKANETVASAGVNVWKVPAGTYPAQRPGAEGGTNWEIWWSKD